MPLDPANIKILGNYDPSLGAIAGLFSGLSKLDPALYALIVENFDDRMLERMAMWADRFASSLNAIESAPDHKVEPGFSVDFDEVMNACEWQGEKLEWSTLEYAQNKMTKALKAKNWLEAIRVGTSLAGVLGGA